jgi:branched-chain amino acid transport system permease protein
MEIFIAQLLGGLITGSIYTLAAVSITFLMLVAGFIQFAHGEIIAISMYVAWLTLEMTGDNLALAIPAAISAATLLGIVLEPITRRLRQRRSFIECLILTVAFGMILTEVMSHSFYHGMPVRFPSAMKGGGATFRLGLIAISLSSLYVLIGCFLILLGFTYFLYRTKRGKALRAIAQDINIARVLGIPVNRATLLSFAITGFMAGVTAVLLAMTLGFASPGLGGVLSFKALAVMLFAGLGNFKGAVICGLVLGMVESLTTGYFMGAWTDAIAMGIIMFTIMMRPAGLFGTRA